MRRAAQSTIARRTGLIACLLFGLAGVLLLSTGSGDRQDPVARSAVRQIDGVPVGVRDTRSGALAAAANYLTLASQSIEQQPTRFAALVHVVYLPSARSQALREASQLRATDTQNMRNYREGGHGFALLGAQRLVTYAHGSPSVLSWLGGVIWGPQLSPRQSWSLVETRLQWRGGRWLLVSSKTTSVPAPVPATVYVRAGNDRTSAFGALAGMSTPVYGAAE